MCLEVNLRVVPSAGPPVSWGMTLVEYGAQGELRDGDWDFCKFCSTELRAQPRGDAGPAGLMTHPLLPDCLCTCLLFAHPSRRQGGRRGARPVGGGVRAAVLHRGAGARPIQQQVRVPRARLRNTACRAGTCVACRQLAPPWRRRLHGRRPPATESMATLRCDLPVDTRPEPKILAVHEGPEAPLQVGLGRACGLAPA